jgi:hypothetical protein
MTTVQSTANHGGLFQKYRRLYNPAVTDGRRSRVPHPGDILFWITCVGAACALLLAVT